MNKILKKELKEKVHVINENDENKNNRVNNENDEIKIKIHKIKIDDGEANSEDNKEYNDDNIENNEENGINNKENGINNKKNEIEDQQKKDKKKIFSRYKIISLAIIVLFLIAGAHVFISLNANSNVQAMEFDNDEVMKINNQKVVMNEFLLYAADVYQGYNLQNEANWDSEITDSENNATVTFEEQVKGTICEQIRMTKVLCMKAQDDGIILSNDEKQILVENAKTYYTDLTSANVIDEGLTIDLITKFYEENALAQKVYNNILDSYDENQDSPTLEDYDTEGTDLSEKELYFIDIYDNLANKYDKNYDYYTSINWDLLEQLSFSDISKDNSTEADTSENTTNWTKEKNYNMRGIK